MAKIVTKDGTRIHYKEWGKGRTLVFSHGWPLSADAWEDQMLFFAARGFRCIAHDRRGFGRSSQPAYGNEMDTYAEDLATLVEELELTDVIHVGHSTGGGEIARYIGRFGTKRVAKVVLISAVTPRMLLADDAAGGLSNTWFDEVRAGIEEDRSRFFRDLSVSYYGGNRPGSTLSDDVRDAFSRQALEAGNHAVVGCLQAFCEADFTYDLEKFDVPTLIMQGTDDQIVRIGTSALLSSRLVSGSTLMVYPGLSHGMCTINSERINADLIAFIEAPKQESVAPLVHRMVT